MGLTQVDEARELACELALLRRTVEGLEQHEQAHRAIERAYRRIVVLLWCLLLLVMACGMVAVLGPLARGG